MLLPHRSFIRLALVSLLLGVGTGAPTLFAIWLRVRFPKVRIAGLERP